MMSVHRPRYSGVLCCVVLLFAQSRPTSSFAADEKEDWTPLFNGKDLTGWSQVNGSEATWSVENGMIACTGKPICILRTERQYENFILELEWRHLRAKGNSGVFVASDAITARGQPFSRAIECQVLDGTESENYTSDGDVFAIHGAVMKPDRPHPGGWMRCLPSEKRSKPSPEWNHYRITFVDGALKLAVNGKEVSGGSEIRPRKGYICLESEGSPVNFRNLRLRELPASSTPLTAEQVATLDEGFRTLYNGLDFAGWAVPKAAEAHWRADDWRIAFDGAAEGISSLRAHGNFELIVDWRWKSPAKKKTVPALTKSGEAEVGADGKPKMIEVDDAGESGISLRGSSLATIDLSSSPLGSGGLPGYAQAAATPKEARSSYLPRVRADTPPGEWNRFAIRLVQDTVRVELNGEVVIEKAALTGLPGRGPILLGKRGGAIEFANVYVKDL